MTGFYVYIHYGSTYYWIHSISFIHGSTVHIGFYCYCVIVVIIIWFVVGGLGFEFCVFVAVWKHALRSEWPFIIIIINADILAAWLIHMLWLAHAAGSGLVMLSWVQGI